jgi:pantoate--beta-alanine ligase
MSSRNERLSPEGRLKASFLYQVLKQSADKEEALHLLAQAGFDVEYLEETQGRRFIAAWLEGVRLIDNISLTEVHSASRKDLTL